MKNNAITNRNIQSNPHIFNVIKKRDIELVLLALPIFAYFIIFHYIPMYGAIIAFQNYSPALGVMKSPWVGLNQFYDLFSNPGFKRIFTNTLIIGFSNLLFGFPIPIILALMLNELNSMKFKKVIQNLTYLPHFISLVVVCGMIKTFTSDTGIIGNIASFFGVEPKTLLNYPKYFVPVYVISDIWQQMGWSSIIYLAALSNVNPSLIEAASIDGAGKMKQLIHITLPAIVPTILTMLILKVGGIVSVGYEKILLLSNDLNIESSDVISTYVYRMGLLNTNWSFSTAVGLFNSVLSFTLLLITNNLSKKANDTSLW